MNLDRHTIERGDQKEPAKEWVLNTVLFPDRVEERKDDEVHYLKEIPDAKGKVLRVIINPILSPHRVITVFFDRRERP
ncbi:DUF4258 domain-containing protein [Methanocalculus taiwanensis]|uniref:DUF4258 domain-containing protein n=1 Tax=Methanocalculus taiwanensis TaxID=106207 RepID=A0ABD4THI2_9EURY|nr:DUF4258 domain-containing protein [Methanocalculus taiwanensis]